MSALRNVASGFVVCLIAAAAAVPARAAENAPGGSDPPSSKQPLSTLSGDLPRTVGTEGSPYVVTANIVVPPGKTVTIEPGVALLFRNFIGLQVHGTLIAAGTLEQPIVLSSEHDNEHGSVTSDPPAPFDWDGVTVTENSVGTTLEFCHVLYSVYGVNALAEYITIRNCVFKGNAKADLTIKGGKQEVATGVPHSYEPLGKPPQLTAEGASPLRIALRTSSIAVFVVGAAIGVWQGIEYADAQSRYETLNDDQNLSNLRNPLIVEEWNETKETRDTNLLGMILGFGGAAIGAVTFTITLF